MNDSTNQQTTARRLLIPFSIFVGSLVVASVVGLLTGLLYGLLVFAVGLVVMVAVLLPGAERKDKNVRDDS